MIRHPNRITAYWSDSERETVRSWSEPVKPGRSKRLFWLAVAFAIGFTVAKVI